MVKFQYMQKQRMGNSKMRKCEKCGSKDLSLEVMFNVETRTYEERIVCDACHYMTDWAPTGRH